MDIINYLVNSPQFDPYKAVSLDEICKAEAELGLKFADDYKKILGEFGAFDFGPYEFAGLGVRDYHNVIAMTNQERELSSDFPMDCYVILDLGYEGAMIIQNQAGEIIGYKEGQTLKLYDSLADYLKSLE